MEAADELAASYASAFEDGQRFADSVALESSLATAIAEAAERFPSLSIDGPAVARYFGERATPDGDDFGIPAHTADLVLAWACARGDEDAFAVLEREYLARSIAVLRRLGFADAEVDDVLQEVRERILLSRDDEPAKIVSFQGSGSLVGWLRAVVGRQGLVRRRRTQIEVTFDETDLFDTDNDPALEALKHHYKDAFANAFHAAVKELDDKDRAILKAIVLDHVPVGKVARLYNVHRVTASRWYAQIRETLLDSTRRKLATTLELDSSEIDSVIRLIRSNLAISLVSALDHSANGSSGEHDEHQGR